MFRETYTESFYNNGKPYYKTIDVVNGDLFTDIESSKKKGCAFINPVNCEGVMGKGLALRFKQFSPLNFKYYRGLYEDGVLRVGCIYPYYDKDNDVEIINFPTKDHWKNPSKLEYIKHNLEQLDEYVRLNGKMEDQRSFRPIEKVFLPAVGCGLGGLSFDLVKLNVLSTFLNHKPHNIAVQLYRP